MRLGISMDQLACNSEALVLHRQINQTTAAYPDGSSVKDLFERCAERHPDTIALIHRDRLLSYRELNRLANSFAAGLRHHGVNPGDAVSVCMERSPELVVAVLAILKCGAAYMPLDTSWPDEWLHRLLNDVHCRWVVSDQANTIAVRFRQCRVMQINLSDLTDSPSNPAMMVAPEAIAYINFTSGSTGRPKGVPIQHRSIARLVFNPRYARLSEHTTLLQLAPITFDASTFEIWGALLHGGTCVLYPSKFVRLSELRQVLETHGVTVLFLTTALFNTVIDQAPETLSSVETILTGGEAHSLKHIGRALELYGPQRLVSVYGPTECTTFATYYPIHRLRPDETALPIGVPIQNTRAYLVNNGRLCRPGEIGEVWLAGPGLSPGYLGTVDTKQENFIECIIDGSQERLYRTGDRAYFSTDGNLVFQGRQDDQEKINGYRIELGEISHHLDGHPNIKQNYVTVSENLPGEKVLLAFIVADSNRCNPVAIRDYLTARLPGYMIPHSIYLCKHLPLSNTGKVDRRALLAVHQA